MSFRADDRKYEMINYNTPDYVLEREARSTEKIVEMLNSAEEKGLFLTKKDILEGMGTVGRELLRAQKQYRTILMEDDFRAGFTPNEVEELRGRIITEDEPIDYQNVSLYSDDKFPEWENQYLPGRAQQQAPRRRILTDTNMDVQPRRGRQTLTERKPVSSNWASVQVQARLKSGEVVPVWKVKDTKNGMAMETVFRIEEIAARIVRVLNESGNANDPRITKLINAYNYRTKLVKQIREMKHQLKEGTGAINKMKLAQLQGELESIDFKLGI